MSDIRHMNREFMVEFLALYQAHPALWKTKSKEYANRNLKNIGYDELLTLYKKVDPSADRNTVAKKIQSLRGSFRKELKKLMKYQSSGAGLDEQYVPSLWYFDLLMFTRDQETSNDGIDSLSAPLTPEAHNDDIDMSQLYCSNLEEEIDDSLTNSSTSPYDECEGVKRIANFKKPPAKKMTKQAASVTTMLTADPEQQQIMQACSEAFRYNSDSESEAFGHLVAAKHSKLSAEQRMYAETIIIQVLNKGILKQLSEHAVVEQSQLYSLPTKYNSSP